ncbi:MAG: OmpA family protein, partial [Gemmatimonadales bacterium]|nr:OmpA family protein [Gemmatimonadales bacterium]
MRALPLALCVPFVIAVIGCTHEKKAVVPPTATNLAEIAPPPSQPAPKAAGPKACVVDLDCGDRQLCIRGTCTEISAGLAECQLVRVHFDYDAAIIQGRDQPGLQRVARCLKADQALLVRIEGNADERGTTEYNLALGDKRATAVARYLERLGVTQPQLKTVSYGEEKPLCVEQD